MVKAGKIWGQRWLGTPNPAAFTSTSASTNTASTANTGTNSTVH